jgi:hypothetical protein
LVVRNPSSGWTKALIWTKLSFGKQASGEWLMVTVWTPSAEEQSRRATIAATANLLMTAFFLI